MKKNTVFFVIMLFYFLLPSGVKAEGESISIYHEIGINDYIKSSEGFPIRFTITNDGKEAFDGDLVVYYDVNYSTEMAKVIPVYVEAGEQKRFYMSHPGQHEDAFYSGNRTEDIVLYKGDWQRGERIAFHGDKKIKKSYIFADSTHISVGILSENPDRFNGWDGLDDERILLFPLMEEKVPQDSLGFEIFDVLVLDEFQLSKLSENQRSGLIEWVERGGVLFVGATPNAKNTYGEIYELLPMEPEKEAILDGVALKKGAAEVLLNDLHVFTGTVEDGIVRKAHEGIPVIVEKPHGFGKIIQTAFSLGDEPNVSAEGYGAYFIELLTGTQRFQPVPNDIYGQLYWEFGELNELFSESNLSATQLLFILFIYLLLLVPGLYILLKRLDKREHAWWLIPALSLTVSLLLFGYGAKDRIKQPLQNELGFFIADQNRLNGFYTVSFQSNSGGDYRFTTNKGEYVPLAIGNPGIIRVETDPPYLTENREEQRIVFPSVEYWSVRSLTGRAFKKLDSSFVDDLSVKENRLTGTVINEYPYDFEEVFIWSGTETYSLGPLKRGEEILVDIQLSQEWLSMPLPLESGIQQWNNLDEMIRNRMMSSSAGLSNLHVNKPVIAGFTKDKMIHVEMEGKDEKTKRLSVILQPFSASVDRTGSFTITNDQMTVHIQRIQGGANRLGIEKAGPSTGMEEVFLESGIYDFVYVLPENMAKSDVTIEEVSMHVQHMSNDRFSILNVSTGELLPINDLGMDVKLTDGAGDYVSDDGTITLRLEKDSNEQPQVFIPELTVKGSANE